jgi:tRNA1Val (adenine37-N6)-methyltransferase
MSAHLFHFKQFTIQQDQCAFKVGTDGVLLGAWANVANVTRVLDIGTGTGLLALMMAQRLPLAQIEAVEIDALSVVQAVENVQGSPWQDRVCIMHTAVQNFTNLAHHKYDLIVSNPPFFGKVDGVAAPEQRRRDARQTNALDHQTLVDCVARLLTENGRFSTILPVIAGHALRTYAETKGLFCVRETAVFPMLNKPQHRVLLEFNRQPQPIITQNLIIETARHHYYTDAFSALTRPFYITIRRNRLESNCC